jgi:hypothetical protein
MSFSRLTGLSVATTLFSLAASQGDANGHQGYKGNPDSICHSYGVDFVDEGHYFINTLSTDNFTSVSIFQGCNQDLAEVLFIDPEGDEVFCSQLPTTPDDTAQLVRTSRTECRI